MEEFNFDSEDDIGSSVSKLKEQKTKKIVDNMILLKPKRHLNMHKFAKQVENDLDNLNNSKNNDIDIDNIGFDIVHPANISNDLLLSQNKDLLNKTTNKTNNKTNNKDKLNKTKLDQTFCGLPYAHRDVIINILLFMALNNKFVIDIINNNIPIISKYNNVWSNLILRSAIFGLVIVLIKKYS